MTSSALTGKVALITGSDSGIGRATAIAFAHEGADIVITYLHDAEGAEGTRRDVEAAGRRAIAIRTDLYGTFFCCRRFIQERKRHGGGGKIINVTSVHEDIPNAGRADYDCSKGGVRNLTRTLALELAPSRSTSTTSPPAWC